VEGDEALGGRVDRDVEFDLDDGVLGEFAEQVGLVPEVCAAVCFVLAPSNPPPLGRASKVSAKKS
jgi:hypothetical protein